MFEKLTKGTSDGLVALSCIAIVLMMLHICVDVAGRYIFNNPVEGTVETVEIYYMVAVVMLPFAYIARGEGHIIVTLFTRGLSPRNIAGLEILVGLLTLAYVAALAWFSGHEAWAKTLLVEVRESGEGMIVAWPTRWLVPLGTGVMVLAVLLRLIEDIKVFLGKAPAREPRS